MENQELPPQSPQKKPVRPPSSSASSHMLWFFLIPCLGFLGWASYKLSHALLEKPKTKSVFERIDDIKKAKTPGNRWQAAYELAQRLSGSDVLNQLNEEDLQKLFRELEILMETHSSDLRLKRYVLMTLSRLAHPRAIPLLEKSLEDKDNELRFFAAWGFADLLLKSPSEQTLKRIQKTQSWCNSPDPSLRKLCASFLVQQKINPEAIEDVEKLLKDPILEVKWNAALALSPTGSELARQILREIFKLENLRSADFRSSKDLFEFLGQATQTARKIHDPVIEQNIQSLAAAVKADTPEGRAILAAISLKN